MIAPLVTAPATPRPSLMEQEGIGYFLQAPQGASKNDVAIESITTAHEGLDAAARGIIAILIGL